MFPRHMEDRRRILVAEEDAERLESLAWLFIKEGFRVTGVDSGFDALKVMLAEKPTLVVLDLDGNALASTARDVVTRMQEDDALRAIPTIVLSASLADQQPLRGATILLKPCSHSVVLATAERLLLPDLIGLARGDAGSVGADDQDGGTDARGDHGLDREQDA